MAEPRRSKLRLLWIPGAILLIAAAAIGGPNLVVSYAAQGYDYTVASTVPARTVAIVPGARVHQGKPFVHLEARLQAALELYRAGRVKAILVSGQNSEESPEVNAMRAWLLEHGVPADHVWSDEQGLRTRDTMNRAVSELGITNAVICTQKTSMERSLFLAQRAGMDAVGLALPSNLEQSSRHRGAEAFKTSVAFIESYLRKPPVRAATRRDGLALR